MSWFGGGSKKEETSRETSFSSDDDDHSYATSGNLLNTAAAGSGGSGGAADLQQFSMGLQQQLMVQQVIGDLCEKAFAKCVTSHRDGQLSGKEVACLQASVHKWLDANEYLLGRLQKKGQQAQQ